LAITAGIWSPRVLDDGLFQWIDWGGQRIWVVGYTSGGAPFGLTEDEYGAPFDTSTEDEKPS
jgi:hypothetical protein